jgi:hypothetical protein
MELSPYRKRRNRSFAARLNQGHPKQRRIAGLDQGVVAATAMRPRRLRGGNVRRVAPPEAATAESIDHVP